MCLSKSSFWKDQNMTEPMLIYVICQLTLTAPLSALFSLQGINDPMIYLYIWKQMIYTFNFEERRKVTTFNVISTRVSVPNNVCA